MVTNLSHITNLNITFKVYQLNTLRRFFFAKDFLFLFFSPELYIQLAAHTEGGKRKAFDVYFLVSK